MNKVYRLIWSHVQQRFVVSGEMAKGKSKDGRNSLIAAVGAVAASFATPLLALPGGGEVAAGQASISQQASTMVVQQASQKAVINWQSFNIAKNETVNFQQPNAAAVALNRIHDSNASQIFGKLNANGQIFLVNSNGINFAKGAEVNVGALTASTLDITDQNFLNGQYDFVKQGDANGVISNAGTINANTIALLGSQVNNSGWLVAQTNGDQRANVALAAGDEISLSFGSNGLLTLDIKKGAYDALVENKQLIQADGGQVLLRAKAAEQLMAATVNNSGIIQAQSIGEQDGRIVLLADMDSGTTNVAGTLDASAPDGGNGGFIETSAATVYVAPGTLVTTKSENGQSGQWLIDPNDFTIAASGGDITGATLSSNLDNNGSVTIQSLDGATDGNGDIFVNDAITWSSENSVLNLQAVRNIEINAEIFASGEESGVDLDTGLSYNSDAGDWSNTPNDEDYAASQHVIYGDEGKITLSGFEAIYRQDGMDYFVINNAYNEQFSITPLQLLSQIGDPMAPAAFALGEDIDASNSSQEFTGINDYSGGFDGLNHSISNLSLSDANDTGTGTGLFNEVSDGFLRNLHIDNISIESDHYEVGALAGSIYNTFVHNVHSSGTISAANDVGGLIGYADESTIENVSSSVNVSGISQTQSYSNSIYFDGAEYIGGLIGSAEDSAINNASATGQVSGANYLGGLLGAARETSISNSRADGQVIGTGGWNYNLIPNAETLELEQIQSHYSESDAVGGLIGELYYSEITSSHAIGSVEGNGNVGGLVGYAYESDISDVSASGNVTGNDYLYSSSYSSSNSYHENEQTNEYSQGGNSIGGLVGYLEYTDINQASASGDVSGRYAIGGLVGYAESYDDNRLDNVSASGKVTGTVGTSASTYLYVSYSTETRVIDSEVVTVNIEQRNQSENSDSYSSYIGGLVGEIYGYSLNNAHATGNVSGGDEVGGLIGYAELYDDNSYNNISASGDVSGQLLSNSYSSTYQEFETIGETRTLITSSNNSETNTTNGYDIGGLIGELYSNSSSAAVDNAHASGDVSGQENVGGLIGYTYNTLISNASASGNVSGVDGSYSATSNDDTRDTVSYSTAIGGFIGYAYGLQLDEVSATGDVNGGRNVGGLIGYAQSNNRRSKSREPEPEESLINIANSFATGAVNSVLDAAGGLIGYARGISLDNVFASGDVTATIDGYTGATYIENADYQGDEPILEISAGGLIGLAEDVILSNAHASGDVSVKLSGDIALEVYTYAGYYDSLSIKSLSDVEESAPTQNLYGLTVSAGGLIGSSAGGQISNAFALGDVDINNSASLNFVSLSYDEGGMGPMLMAEVIENSEEPTLIYQPFNVVIASAAGGLIGNSEGDSVNTVYATGDVSQVDSFQTTSNGPDGQEITFAKHALVGGLVGLATADMEDDGYDMPALSISAIDEPTAPVSAGFEQAYAIGNVSYQGDSDAGAGGLMGQIDGIQIDQTFATGSVAISGNGGNASGGLIGLKDGSQGMLGYADADMDFEYELMMLDAPEMPVASSTISNSYWNSDANAQGIGEDAAPAEAAVNVAGLSVAELKQEDSYAGFEFGACGGDASWCIVEGKTIAGLNALYQSVAADITGLENYSKVYDGSAAFVAATGYSLDSGTNKLVFTEADFGLSNGSANAGIYGSDQTSLDGIYSAQYELALNAGDREITITKAALTITAFDDEHLSGSPYAGNNGSQVVGFVNGETEANLNGSLSYGGSAQGANQVGQYAISPQGFSSDNYDISYIDGVLTVETSFDPALQAAANQANTQTSVPSNLASPAGLLEFGAPAAGPDGEEIEVIMDGDVKVVNGGSKQPSLEEMLQAL